MCVASDFSSEMMNPGNYNKKRVQMTMLCTLLILIIGRFAA